MISLEPTPVEALEATPETIRQWQEQDPTMHIARDAVGAETGNEEFFYQRKRLFYRY